MFPTARSRTRTRPAPIMRAIVDNYGGMDLQLLGLGHNGHIGFNEPADEVPEDHPTAWI